MRIAVMKVWTKPEDLEKFFKGKQIIVYPNWEVGMFEVELDPRKIEIVQNSMNRMFIKRRKRSFWRRKGR